MNHLRSGRLERHHPGDCIEAYSDLVGDLAGLDLAYAPPFGSARDPLHMAAFAAQNDLDGVSRVIQPEADLSAYQVVDVREPHDLASMPLADAPHARHIPLDQLRDRLGEVDPALPTVVACRSVLRSYVGTRILAQHGFAQVFNLSGAAAMRDFALNRRLPASLAVAGVGIPAPDAIKID